jgi:hypothetical protein
VRSYVRTIAKPGIKMIDLCEQLEAASRALTAEDVRCPASGKGEGGVK